jgi:hypothetical protein
MDGQNVPKLDVGLNLAITFAPNEQECLAMGKPFPMKIKNVTAAKTQQGNNVKPQFKVRHICYYSWMLTQEDVDAISASLSNCVTNGEDYKEPLQGNPDKVVEWEDISNLPPKKVEGTTLQQSKDNNKLNTEQYMNKKQIRLTESDLKQIVKESVNKILNEAYGTMPKDDIKRVANLDAASQSRFDERGEEIEDIKNDEFSRRLQNLQRDLTKCWWMANSLGSHMKHNEFLGKASERYANYVMDNISNASDGLDRIIAIAKMKIGQ